MKTTCSPFVAGLPVVLAAVLCALTVPAHAQSPTNPPTFLPEVALRATVTNASEAGVSGRLVVTRTGATNNPLTVFLGIGGTAANGVDYVAIPSTLLFRSGVRTLELSVTPIDDLLVEAPEKAVFELRLPLAPLPPTYVLSTNRVGMVVIADNDVQTTNRSPVVSLETPTNGAVFLAPANIHIAAAASDADGFVATVAFFAGTNRLGITTNNPLSTSPVNPFQITWSNVPPGFYELSALAVDNRGAATRSPVVPITVRPPPSNQPPVVRWEGPPAGTVLTPPAFIRLAAFAADSDGAVSRVEFFNGTNSLGLGTVSVTTTNPMPASLYTLVWSNVPAGQYFLSAQATDNQAATARTPGVAIAVVAQPARVSVKVKDPEAAESGLLTVVNTGIFTLGRDGDTNISLTVGLALDGTARNGLDYSFITNRVVIPAGQRLVDVVVNALRDNLVEGTETVVLRVLDPVCGATFPPPPECYQVGWPAEGVVYIRDANSPTNPPPPTITNTFVTIMATDPLASEGTNWLCWAGTSNCPPQCNRGVNMATFKVRRVGATNANLVVRYAIRGSASNGVDYVTLPGWVTIPAGQSSAEITVAPIDDARPEPLENVVLMLRAPEPVTNTLPPYLIARPAEAGAVIVDNDRFRPPTTPLCDGDLHVNLPATNGLCYRLDFSTDMRTWTPVLTNRVTKGAFHYVDTERQRDPSRFYRVVTVPCAAE